MIDLKRTKTPYPLPLDTDERIGHFASEGDGPTKTLEAKEAEPVKSGIYHALPWRWSNSEDERRL